MEVKFPCSIGDYIYIISLNKSYHTNYIYKCRVKEFRVTDKANLIIVNAYYHPDIPIAVNILNFGKIFFLTKEEAIEAIGPNYKIQIFGE